MKKIFVFILVMTPYLSQAQLWHVGAHAGVSFSNYKSKTPWKESLNTGAAFEVIAFKQVNSNFGYRIALGYVQKGYFHKICNDITDQLKASYIEVPFMVDYTFIIPAMKNWKAHINGGAYTAYWMSAKYKMKGFDETDENFDFKKSKATRFDFGPTAGGRIDYILKNGNLSLDFRYELGLADLQKLHNDDTKNTNRAFIIGLTYMKLISKH
jgi:hypothetical protein